MVEDYLLQMLQASSSVKSGIITRGLNEGITSNARHRRTEMLLAAVTAILNSNLHRLVNLCCNVSPTLIPVSLVLMKSTLNNGSA